MGLTPQLSKWQGCTCGLPSQAVRAQPGLPACTRAPPHQALLSAHAPPQERHQGWEVYMSHS